MTRVHLPVAIILFQLHNLQTLRPDWSFVRRPGSPGLIYYHALSPVLNRIVSAFGSLMVVDYCSNVPTVIENNGGVSQRMDALQRPPIYGLVLSTIASLPGNLATDSPRCARAGTGEEPWATAYFCNCPINDWRRADVPSVVPQPPPFRNSTWICFINGERESS